MSIYAISDLHLVNKVNQEALSDISDSDYKNDWLTLAGDIGESEEHLELALAILSRMFKKIIWVPGNHDLWTIPLNRNSPKGEEKYNKLVSICHKYGAFTPEDSYQIYNENGQEYCLAPIMTLYDYSFKPENVDHGKELEWAAESGVICADEDLLITHPHRSIREWSNDRCFFTEERLKAIPGNIPIIIINHYPLLKKLGRIFTYPRFSIWCGTIQTEKWLSQFNIEIVIYGHLHIRSSKSIDGIRHEEVSLGYPHDWNKSKGLDYYFKKIL